MIRIDETSYLGTDTWEGTGPLTSAIVQRPYPLKIHSGWKTILCLNPDGTLETTIDQADEAARIFVTSLQREWAMAVSAIKAEAYQRGWDDATLIKQETRSDQGNKDTA